MSSVLEKYLPAVAIPLLQPLLNKHTVQIRICKPRKSKFGDYRFPRAGQPHRISINADLNPYAFLITLLHEYAHLEAYHHFGRKIKAHGPEWQNTFQSVSRPFLEAEVFPTDLTIALERSLLKGHASSASAHELFRLLKTYDHSNSTFVEDLAEGTYFQIGKKVFRKGPKSRKRYRCQSINNARIYMVHPLAEVEPLDNPKYA